MSCKAEFDMKIIAKFPKLKKKNKTKSEQQRQWGKVVIGQPK